MRPLLPLLLLLATSIHASDLTIATISRLPEIDYVWNSSDPAREGWPTAGESVTWRANVRSWFDEERTIEYVWRLDGAVIRRGQAVLAPNATTAIDLPLPWTFERHRLSCEIDADGMVAEESERNNELAVFTDALAVGFWVEQSVVDFWRAHQHELGIGSTGVENWAQRHIDLFNDMAAMAVFDETPRGVLDRLRLQKIVVVPDGALPLVPPPNEGEMNGQPNGMTHPDMSDRSVDLQIGIRASTVAAVRDTRSVTPENAFYIATAILHELGHARYLTDVYAFDVRHDPPGKSVEVPGLLASSTIYYTPAQGLMNRHFTFIDRYSAIALNRIAGRRATVGNYNDPENIGAFLNDLPQQNRVTLVDGDGVPLSNRRVELYQARMFTADEWYSARYDSTPDLVVESDAEGRILVGRNPFGDGEVTQYWRGNNSVVILRVESGGRARFGFLESRLFNLAWWRGERELADHEIVVGSPLCRPELPRILAPGWDESVRGAATLRWTEVDDAVSYTVWAAPAGGAPREVGTTTSTELRTTTLTGSTYWWVEAALEDCPAVRSETSRMQGRTPKRRAVR